MLIPLNQHYWPWSQYFSVSVCPTPANSTKLSLVWNTKSAFENYFILSLCLTYILSLMILNQARPLTILSPPCPLSAHSLPHPLSFPLGLIPTRRQLPWDKYSSQQISTLTIMTTVLHRGHASSPLPLAVCIFSTVKIGISLVGNFAKYICPQTRISTNLEVISGLYCSKYFFHPDDII